MKLIPSSLLHQKYSFAEGIPDQVWAVRYSNTTDLGTVIDGFPESLLDVVSELSTDWTGWGFILSEGHTRLFLLFVNRDDAMLSAIRFGNGRITWPIDEEEDDN